MINAVEVQTQHPINVHRWRLLEVEQRIRCFLEFYKLFNMLDSGYEP